MYPTEMVSVADMKTKTTRIFTKVDHGEDIFVLSHNEPKYVVLNYQRFMNLLEEIDDLQDMKTIQQARKSKTQEEAWETFKKSA